MNYIQLSQKFRARLSEKIMDLGNIVAGALVFAPFLSEKKFSIPVVFLGMILTIVTYIFSYITSNK